MRDGICCGTVSGALCGWPHTSRSSILYSGSISRSKMRSRSAEKLLQSQSSIFGVSFSTDRTSTTTRPSPRDLKLRQCRVCKNRRSLLWLLKMTTNGWPMFFGNFLLKGGKIMLNQACAISAGPCKSCSSGQSLVRFSRARASSWLLYQVIVDCQTIRKRGVSSPNPIAARRTNV